MTQILNRYKFLLFICSAMAGLFFLSSCNKNNKSSSFVSIGEFSIKHLPNNCYEIRDGAGRIMALVPREQRAPKGYKKNQIIRIPVHRVVAYSGFNISLLKALGVLNTLVGVTHEKKYWTINEVIKGMDNGKIVCIGKAGAIDFERLKALKPDLVLTWDASAVAKITDLGIPGIITTTGEAMSLDTRMRFIKFLSLFFNKEKIADNYIARVKNTIQKIKDTSEECNRKWKNGNRPKIIWGDIFENRVLVEPGNSWAAEMIKLSGGKYLFNDIKGAS